MHLGDDVGENASIFLAGSLGGGGGITVFKAFFGKHLLT